MAGFEDRPNDEWLGNGVDEQWAPDCVWYGTAEYNQAAWLILHGAVPPPPVYRMSPQTVRITLLASPEEIAGAGGIATNQVMAIEDRGVLTSITGARHQHLTLTERFTPRNLRWRDPSI